SPSGTTAEAGAGRFSADPDPCSLLEAAQVRAFGPTSAPVSAEAKGDDEAYCSWFDSGGPSLRVQFTRKSPTSGKTASEVAHAFFAAERVKTKADEGTSPFGWVGPLRDVKRVGAEAFGYDVGSLDRVTTVVRLRISNLLVEVSLSEEAKRVSPELRAKGLRAARLVAEELNGRD
ncbi:hypothetical protein ACFQ08_38665, partial [Streptosporangium algeriense]